MKFRNKGRKIYKTKEKNYYGKTPAGKFFSGALTVLLLGGIGFLGYSVAEPIINYTKKRGDNDISAAATTEDVRSSLAETATAATISVQENVKKAVETMTGLRVVEVNVNVQGVNVKADDSDSQKLK